MRGARRAGFLKVGAGAGAAVIPPPSTTMLSVFINRKCGGTLDLRSTLKPPLTLLLSPGKCRQWWPCPDVSPAGPIVPVPGTSGHRERPSEREGFGCRRRHPWFGHIAERRGPVALVSLNFRVPDWSKPVNSAWVQSASIARNPLQTGVVDFPCLPFVGCMPTVGSQLHVIAVLSVLSHVTFKVTHPTWYGRHPGCEPVVAGHDGRPAALREVVVAAGRNRPNPEHIVGAGPAGRWPRNRCPPPCCRHRRKSRGSPGHGGRLPAAQPHSGRRHPRCPR